MHYKIKEVALKSGISIRMLHYYDKIGLLRPQRTTQSGYRLYSEEDLDKLSQILFYKELEFSMEDIKHIINSNNLNKIEVLKLQEQMLERKRKKIEALIYGARKTIEALEQNNEPKNTGIFTSFDFAEIKENEESLKAKLMTQLLCSPNEGCRELTANYVREDWTIVMSKANVILNNIYESMDRGHEDIKIQEYIKEFKEFLDNYFWKFSDEAFRILGDLYVNNSLYRGYLNQFATLFPEFIRKAIFFYVGEDINEKD